MSKHTPGPWRFCDMRRWGGASSFYIEAPSGGDQRSPNVALIPKSTIHDSEANAALIAAAPELLFALRYALPFISENAITTEACENGGSKVADVIRAAIAKAEGATA